jgi:hypothetical protein
VTCSIFQRIVDDRSGRTVEELVAVLDGNHSPGVALSMWFADEAPPAGTYTAEVQVGDRMRTATLRYDPATAGGRRCA